MGRFYQLRRVLLCHCAASVPWGRQAEAGWVWGLCRDVAEREAEPQHSSDCLSVKWRGVW